MKIYITAFLMLLLPLPLHAADAVFDKFARKIARYELPAPTDVELLLVESKTGNEWSLLIRMEHMVKRSIVVCDSYKHTVHGKETFSEGCDLQVGRTIASINPSQQNNERVLYVSEIGDSLYVVDGTLDNHFVQGFKVLKSNVLELRHSK